MARIHICLVSAQPIPNLIPLRMEGLKPEKVILLVTPDMTIQSERLEKVIKSWGIKVEKHPIAPYDLNSARETCIGLLTEYENEEMILNATGGTKIMAFAAFEVFRELGKKIIYVDTQDKLIQMLSPDFKKIDFAGVIKVPQYLQAYGQTIISEKDTTIINKHIPIFNELVKLCDIYQDAVKILNKYSAPFRNARTFPLDVKVEEDDSMMPGFKDLMMLFEKHDILYLKNGILKFKGLDDIEFVSGGWLEEYVYSIVKSINVTDIRMGVEVRWDTPGKRHPFNEYDIVFTHNNRLYLIECKTKRFEGLDIKDSNDNAIYKLDSLRDKAGGVYGKGMLVSYQRLTDEQKRRLSANRLEFCDGIELRNLKNRIQKWIE